jgi:NhaP-type Na+/H+ or K+/H+ antiporter
MVFFLFFVNLAKGGSTSVVSVVGSFVQNSLVGPVLGVIIAFVASLWTRRVVGDDVQVTWLTFVFTYICFYLCEFTAFHTSGILGVICLGLFWSAFGKTKIRPESEHAVHTVWSFVQYSADTLIFLLVGIIVGTVVI